MFRAVGCVVTCAIPFLISAPAGAQSFVSVQSDAEVSAPAPSAPTSITQRYIAASPSTGRDLTLLIDEAQTMAPPAPAPRIVMTSPAQASVSRMAINDLGIGRAAIVVSNVRGFNNE